MSKDTVKWLHMSKLSPFLCSSVVLCQDKMSEKCQNTTYVPLSFKIIRNKWHVARKFTHRHA